MGRIQRTMERREEKELSKRIEKKSPRLEKQGEVRKAKAERERREKVRKVSYINLLSLSFVRPA